MKKIDIYKKLRSSGLRPTKQRVEIAKFLFERDKTIHFTVRTAIIKDKKRIDGRGLADVRQIKCEVGVLPRTHGSALFTRGETQALVVTTLGMSDDEQRVESLNGMQRNRFTI